MKWYIKELPSGSVTYGLLTNFLCLFQYFDQVGIITKEFNKDCISAARKEIRSIDNRAEITEFP